MTMDIEDDVFFADLSKQIDMLITDDDDNEEEFPVRNPWLNLQGFQHVQQAIIPPPYTYEMANRRESKGTGVFIPRSTVPRRKNRTGRSSSINSSSQRQLDKSRLPVSHVANNDNLQSNYYRNAGSMKNHT